MVFILPSCPNRSPVSDSLHARNTPAVQTHFILEETTVVSSEKCMVQSIGSLSVFTLSYIIDPDALVRELF